ncbi:MAG: hypothetical protein M3T96_02745 [Acidobacteriota bacterium]|nr:hypothetical protein [Acidobacteriota bacterium]
MKKSVLLHLFAFVCFCGGAFAQNTSPTVAPTRPREVVAPTDLPAPTPTIVPRLIITNAPTPMPTPTAAPRPFSTPANVPPPINTPVSPTQIYPAPVPSPISRPAPTFYKPLTFAQIKKEIAEARRQMQARPMHTAMTDSATSTDFIRIAFYDYKTEKIDYVVMLKTTFLDKKSAEYATTTAEGKMVTVKNVRANGVNTPVLVIDQDNRAQLPLLVQYPVERDGEFYEMAYYMSTHPGIVTPEVVNAGRIYVRGIIDTARTNLQKKGVYVSPQITDMAERLSIVEHVDHQRFKTEYQATIFNDIFALYALNEGQTYRYSVSTAGAGGMVQMIPWTYNMIRQRFPGANLMPDFVEGMRNHTNAATAMLLYMQTAWSDMTASETVNQALADGIATPAELMSAGYNSNPAKIAGYIKRGGANWKNLIPKETQIYLQINTSMDKFVPYIPRQK